MRSVAPPVFSLAQIGVIAGPQRNGRREHAAVLEVGDGAFGPLAVAVDEDDLARRAAQCHRKHARGSHRPGADDTDFHPIILILPCTAWHGDRPRSIWPNAIGLILRMWARVMRALLDNEDIGRHGARDVSANAADAARRRRARRLDVFADDDERRPDRFDVAAD